MFSTATLSPSKVLRLLEDSSDSEEEKSPSKALFIPEDDYQEALNFINSIGESEDIPNNVLNIQVPSINQDIEALDFILNNEVPTFEVEEVVQNYEEAVVQENGVGNVDFQAERATNIRLKRKQSNEVYENQRLRENGIQYTGRKGKKGENAECVIKEERVMKETCESLYCQKSNKRHCNTFTEADRVQNFNEFWRHNIWAGKKSMINALIECVDPVQKCVLTGGKERQCSNSYYLFKEDGKRYPVCQNMFCSTLGIHRNTIRGWLKGKKKKVPRVAVPAQVTVKKQRKRSEQQQKDRERKAKLNDFLDKLPRVPSHYCRSSTSREYLERPFYSIKQVYKLYTEDTPNYLSWATFLRAFKEKKLSIFVPKKDFCNICARLSRDSAEWMEHNAEQKRAQAEKAKDKLLAKNPDMCVFCADVQSGLPCPQLFVNAAYYRTKLICHNYTIHEFAHRGVECYFWSEDEAGLEADVFISCLLDFLNEALRLKPTIKHFIMYTDSCPAQNKNIKLSNQILHFCVEHDVTLEQKFLVTGHTYMEADSVHSMIERQCRRKEIFSPMNYVERIVSARQMPNADPYQVHYLKCPFFKSHKNVYYDSIRPGTGAGDSKVCELRVLSYRPSGEIFYKLSFDDEVWSPIPGVAAKKIVKPPTRLYRKKPGITKSKQKHLSELQIYVTDVKAKAFFQTIIN